MSLQVSDLIAELDNEQCGKYTKWFLVLFQADSQLTRTFQNVHVDIDKTFFCFFWIHLLTLKLKNNICKNCDLEKHVVTLLWKGSHTSTMNQWHREPLSSKHPLFWEVIKSN